jgi:hypothetical protein
LTQLNGDIELEEVHFAYPTRPDHFVFNGFNLIIPAGKFFLDFLPSRLINVPGRSSSLMPWVYFHKPPDLQGKALHLWARAEAAKVQSSSFCSATTIQASARCAICIFIIAEMWEHHDIYSAWYSKPWYFLLTQIMVDGHDIRTLQLEWWRSQVSLVSQEPTLFDDSVYANIAMSKPGEYFLKMPISFVLAQSTPEVMYANSFDSCRCNELWGH